MPGGLIQIVAYGAQDLFLTGIPEITHFKYIYKRYTNFAMEFLELPFNGTKNFGETITCPIPKNGDLINSTILKIELPKVVLSKSSSNNDLVTSTLSEFNDAESNIINFNNFIKYIYESIYIANSGINNSNETFTNINTSISSYLDSNKNFILLKNKVGNDVKNAFDIEADLTNISSKNINELEKKNLLKITIDSYIERSKNFLYTFQIEYTEKKKSYDSSLLNNYNFCWIKDLGWNIMNNIELQIGGIIIDRQYSIWLHLWNELFENILKKSDYDYFFCKNSNGYTFDNTEKDSMYLYLPLKFFFNRHIGLSLPLISIRNQEILFKLKLESLNNLIYTDYDGLDINDLIKINDIKILTNFIYLDQDERSKFAQASHEYLIEQVNKTSYNRLKSDEINLELNLNHPTKYYILTLQNKSDIDSYKFYNDYSGNFNYTVTNNFPNIDTNKNNTVNNAQLELNGVDRTSNYDGSYYNYVTSYETNINTPADGINFYSFALNPNDIQPSGTCNFSRLNRKTIKLSLTDEFLNRISSSDYILINFLSVNYNILKFNKGLCNLVFAY